MCPRIGTREGVTSGCPLRVPFACPSRAKSAIGWARREVGYFPGGLRDQLLARDWADVHLFAWLPADLEDDLRESLDASFVVRLGKEYSVDWSYVAAEIGYIQTHLLTTQRAVFLYQADYLRLKRGFPIKQAPGEELVVFNLEGRAPPGERQEVWVYLDHDFEDSESVSLTMHRGKWPQHGLGLLTSAATISPRLDVNRPESPRAMAELSARAHAILVPAWRGDAFIFVEWPRSKE